MRAASEGASAPVVGVRASIISKCAGFPSPPGESLAPLLANLSATVWFAVVDSRSK